MPFSLIIHFKQSYSNVFSRVRSNTLVISSSHLAITTFINAGFGYFYWIVAAHLYPAETVGMSAALISVLSLVATMAPLGLESALVKVLLESRENWARKVYSLFLTIFFSTLLLGILILPLVDALNGGKTGIVSSFWSGLVFILTCLFWTLSLVLDQLFIVEQTTILVLIRNSITACLKLLLLPVTLMITGSDSPLVILAGWGVAALFSSVVTFLIFAWLRRSNLPLQFSLDFRLVRSMLPISMGNYSITVTQQIPATVLPIIVTQMLSPQHNAYFYTVFMFVQGVLLTFPLAISQSFFAQTNNTGLPELLLKMKALLRLTWLIMVPMILGTILLHDPILALFGGEYVREGSGLLVVMSLGTLPATYIRLYISLQRIRNDFKRGFLTTCASLFALIIASFISIQLFGLIGVGIGWTSGLFIVACGLKLDMFHLSRQAAQGRPQQTPWPHAVEDLKNRLQEPSIQDMVRKVLGDSSLEVLEWDITRLSGPLANPLSGGIYRVAGTAWDNEQIRNWSAVLKIVTRPSGGGDRPGDWNYWKREALAYQSGLLANLPGGLAAPRCFAVEEALNHREIWMWLEEVKDSSHSFWTPIRYWKVAQVLGEFNGAYLTHNSLPKYPWLSRRRSLSWIHTPDSGGHEAAPESLVVRLANNSLRPVLDRFAPAVVNRGVEMLYGRSINLFRQEATWQDPAVQQAFPVPIADRLLRLWEHRKKLVDALGHLPRTLCHLDVWNPNLFEAQGEKGHETTVALDWEFLGYGAIGEEIVQLVWCNLLYFKIELAEAALLEEIILDSYIQGLRKSGWQGDSRQVRLGYAASAALRWGLSAPGLSLALHPDQQVLEERRWGRPAAKIIRERAAMTYHLLDLADEAFKLIEEGVLNEVARIERKGLSECL